MLSLIILSFIGFSISFYIYLLEKKVKKNPDFKPACDINDRISCTKVINSPYTNLFFVSNSILGMLYYLIIFTLTFLNYPALLLAASITAILVSLYLAYILYFKIKSLCLLCTSLYIINVLILIVALYNFNL
jgi:vitamin-K-epoxide reductase (warfarin-sensitive)